MGVVRQLKPGGELGPSHLVSIPRCLGFILHFWGAVGGNRVQMVKTCWGRAGSLDAWALHSVLGATWSLQAAEGRAGRLLDTWVPCPSLFCSHLPYRARKAPLALLAVMASRALWVCLALQGPQGVLVKMVTR